MRLRRPIAWALTILVLVGVVAPPGAAAPALRTGGVPVRVKQTQRCSLFAPVDWSVTGNPQGSTAEAVSADRTMYAGWGVVAIDRAMQPYYGDLYAAPETSIRFLASQILAGMLGDTSGMRYTSGSQPFLGYFTLRQFESAGHVGLVFYRIYPGPTPQAYVESVYFAIAAKTRARIRLQTAAGVAVSIRCVTQLLPRTGEPGGGRPGKSSRVGCGTGGNLRGYQKELGSQYAYSPSTGQNFLLDPSANWNENGPQGPGYYRAVGNSYEKLELGRSDDC